jgi:Uncharacterized conserved protein
MSTYYSGSGLTYLQYLQAKSFVSDVKGAQQNAAKAINLSVSTQTREMIASQEALARENIRSMDAGFGRVAEATEEGFEQLSWEIRDVSRSIADVGHGISELNATFQWGLSEMLSQMTRMNSAVSELVKLARSPIQTEANEYFQNARDGLRRGLYPEALDEVEKAIAKHKLEWRYYSLAGTIRLGSVSGGLELLDLGKAEEYFLLAARYAKVDSPLDAARSYLAASWAAYCQGKMGPALSNVEEALELDPQLAEALFQAGKVYMALREPDNALPLLGKAIELDKGYALKAAADGDFQRYDEKVRCFLDSIRQARLQQIRPGIEAALQGVQFWFDHSGQARRHEVVERAQSILSRGLPLWDLLDQWDELRSLPDAIRQAARQPIFTVHVVTGPVFQVHEPPNADELLEKEASPFGWFHRRPSARSQEKKRRASKISPMTATRDGAVIKIQDGTGTLWTEVELVRIPSGRFVKGSDVGDRATEERQEITITYDFVIARVPITKAQWNSVMKGEQEIATGIEAGTRIGSVSWFDAVAFCNALSRATGLPEAYEISEKTISWKGLDCGGYRLPGETEWEYAVRADTVGNLWVSRDANTLGSSPHPAPEEWHLRPNNWGVSDIGRECEEWVNDWFEPDFYANCILIDPVGPSSGRERTSMAVVELDVADQPEADIATWRREPSRAMPNLGFRCARTMSALGS